MSASLDAQQQIFSGNPDDRRAFESLEEHFFLQGDWQALTDIYRQRISAASIVEDTQETALLLFRLGQILDERVGDPDAASEVYWKLAKLDPSNRSALQQLGEIHKRREQWDMVLQIAELESQTIMPASERAALETEVGRLWQDQFGDPEEARKAFERALAADPELPEALVGLAALHREAGRFEDSAALYEQLTGRIRGPERAPVWIALGSLFAGPLGDASYAMRCFEAALDDDPLQIPAVEWLLMFEIADGNWETVGSLMETRFELASGAEQRAAIAVEASQIQHNLLGSAAAAYAWLDRAAELAPDEISVLLARADVDRAEADDAALLATLNRLISVAGQHAPPAVLVEAAQLQADSSNPEAALDTLRTASELPGHNNVRLLSVQARVLRESGSKPELAEVLEKLTALDQFKDEAQRAGLLRELAGLREADLADAAGAHSAWQRACDREPQNDECLGALTRIHSRLSK